MSKVKILFLAADPSDAARLRLGQELRDIREKLQLAKQRDNFSLESRESVRPGDITQAIFDVDPQIVHFSGHGISTGELCFEDIHGKTHPVQIDALASLFELLSEQVNCVVLNACYSEAQAKSIAQHISFVIGMNQAIGDKAAIAFAVGFYRALGSGRSFENAYRFACVEIQFAGTPGHLIPTLYTRQDKNIDIAVSVPSSNLSGQATPDVSENSPSLDCGSSTTGQNPETLQLLTRQQFLKILGVGSFGVIGTVTAAQFLRSLPERSGTATAMPVPTSVTSPKPIPNLDLPQKITKYSKLEELLKERKWEAANSETNFLIFDPFLKQQLSVERTSFIEYFREFPCDVFNEIDTLWIKHSSGRFGFSVQRGIYLECKAFSSFLANGVNCFGDRIGWRVNNEWISRGNATFDASAPSGHLPFVAIEPNNNRRLFRGLITLLEAAGIFFINYDITPSIGVGLLLLGSNNEDETYPGLLVSKLANCRA
ncbi:GUN4 domain-containing protein [Phormidesmis sp. 146-35]